MRGYANYLSVKCPDCDVVSGRLCTMSSASDTSGLSAAWNSFNGGGADDDDADDVSVFSGTSVSVGVGNPPNIFVLLLFA